MVTRDRLDPRPFANVGVVENSLVIEPAECVRLAEHLLALLSYEWESNHSEHCSNTWPHSEGQQARCMWPRPHELSLFQPVD